METLVRALDLAGIIASLLFIGGLLLERFSRAVEFGVMAMILFLAHAFFSTSIDKMSLALAIANGLGALLIYHKNVKGGGG